MLRAIIFLTLCMPVFLFSQVHYVKLRSFPPQWERLEVGFVVSEVIDRRVDTTNVGYALTGMGNKRKAAKFKKRLPVELKRAVDEHQLITSEKPAPHSPPTTATPSPLSPPSPSRRPAARKRDTRPGCYS